MKSSRCSLRLVEEGLTLDTKNGIIAYSLKRSSARRTLSICVNEKASVIVSTPAYLNQERIISFLHEKSEWILAKVDEIQATRNLTDKKFISGEGHLFLGQKYPIQMSEEGIGRSKIEFNGQCWTVYLPAGLDDKEKSRLIKFRLEDWYKKQAKEILGGRLFKYADIVGVVPKTVEIRTQKRVWGNCDYRKERIHLNWQIILAPMDVIDYVIVHELCHLIEPNHSHRFWKQVRKFVPDFEKHKKWLKDNHWEMLVS